MQNFILVYQLKLFFYFLLLFQCDALVFIVLKMRHFGPNCDIQIINLFLGIPAG
ncbi:Uncharacterised protein [Serratia liquefaciens]|nr:Uncharacterised protein [Serratia liquefaciens]